MKTMHYVVLNTIPQYQRLDFIERGEKEGLPKQMEWFAALGVVITLVWLYLEILRLLAKLRDN